MTSISINPFRFNATSSVSSTQNPTAPAQATSVATAAPLASAVVPTQNRTIAGFPQSFQIRNLIPSNWQPSSASDGMTGNYIARPSPSRFVAYGDISKVKPTADGFTVSVDVFTTEATDKSCLFLQLPVRDAISNSLTYITLDVLTHDAKTNEMAQLISTQKSVDPISRHNVFTGKKEFSISLKDINSFLKKSGLNLEVKPGDQLSISGILQGSGHRIMNGASNTFAIPTPLATTTPLASRLLGLSNQTVQAQDLPLDICVKLSEQDMRNGHVFSPSVGTIFAHNIIEGEITTRLESEYKGSVKQHEMLSMCNSAYQLSELSEKALAGDSLARKQLDMLLGKDLVLTPVKRHWMCSDGKALGNRDEHQLGNVRILKDAQGLPVLDPMKDMYSDDANFTFTKASGAARIRSNSQKGGHAEFKMNGGVLDKKTGIRQRVEIGVSLKPNITEERFKIFLQGLENTPLGSLAQTPLNHIITEARKANVLKSLTGDRTAWASVEQIRHKFELRNTKTGTCAELSLDTVTAKELSTGKTRTFYVIESELDHLQIQSSNVVETQSVFTRSASTNSKEQEAAILDMANGVKNGSKKIETMKGAQLHSIDHIEDGSFRQTASYKDFEMMQEKLLKAICQGFTPGPARQKASHFAELLGLIPPENTRTT